MKKTFVCLAGTVLIIILAFACEMPSSIEIKSDNFSINAPVKIGRFNLATVLSTTMKDSFPEGFEFYDMVDYQGSLAFLVAYPMDLMESFNPDDYFADLKKQVNAMDDLGEDETVDPDPIEIPAMSSEPPSNLQYYFSMNAFFEYMWREININSTTVTSYSSSSLPLPPFDLDVFTNHDFDSIMIDTGNVVLDVWLDFTTQPSIPSDFELEIGGIVLNTTPLVPQVAMLDFSNNFQYSVVFNLNGKVMTNPAQFQLGSITVNNAGGAVYTLHVKPRLQDITLNGAVALKVGYGEEPVPIDIIDNINGTHFSDDMLNAKVANGKFRITDVVAPHYSYNTSPDRTNPPMSGVNDGLYIGYKLNMNQASVLYEGYVFQGLNGMFWDKINGTAQGISDADLLDGKWISGKELTVDIDDPLNKIIIQADSIYGSTFSGVTYNAVYDEWLLPIEMDMGMDIDELEVVQWKSSALPLVEVPIDFSDDDGENVYIKTITFSRMEMNVNFTTGLPPELNNKLELQLRCPDLGFDENSGPLPYLNPRPLIQDDNDFTGTPKELEVDHDNPEIKIFADFIPIIDGVSTRNKDFPYIQFGPVDMSDPNGFSMNIYAEVSMDYDWTEAEIDMQAAMRRSDRDVPEGTFPENSEDEPIDMSDFGRYLHGITFAGDIKAKIFFGGPVEVVEKMQPKLLFKAEWGRKEEKNENGIYEYEYIETMIDNLPLLVDDTLPTIVEKDPGGEYVYRGLDLPLPNQGEELSGSFNRIFSSYPTDLHFYYQLVLPDSNEPLTVYHEDFRDDEEGENSKIKALLVFIIPLEFIAEPGGYLAIPKEDLFGEDDDGRDLFGRYNAQDYSPFTGVNIKSLGINIGFDSSLLRGSYLHFDQDDLLFGPKGLHVGDNNNYKFVFTSDQIKTINENLIFPDIKFIFPKEETLNVGKYCLPLKIGIAASGSITLDLENLDLGN